MSFSYSQQQLRDLVQMAVHHAKKLGATDSVADVSESVGLSVNVRQGEIDTIEQNRDKSFGVTVYLGQQKGNASSSDFSSQAIEQTVAAALDIARYTAKDECAGLPEKKQLEKSHKDLDLYHPWKLSTEEAVDIALAVEASALGVSPMIRNSEGASVSTDHSHFAAANSRGFLGGYAHSRHYMGVSIIAQEKKRLDSPMHRDYWHSSARRAKDLAKPEAVGEYAARRALSRLGAKSIPTQKCPVIFEAPLACGLLGSFVQAVSGGALYRKTTFLPDCLGQRVWADHIDIHEDPFIKRALGSSPFDEEGCKVKARDVVSKGVVKGYFLSTYTARKLGVKTTGNAGGSHNLRLTSRLTRKKDSLNGLLKTMGTGLLITELMGQGVNYVTGDYSRGAFGYWVENGIIVHPVQEITIAGNLKEMFANVVAVGSDEITYGTKTTGSILIDGMTIASAA